MPHLLPWRLREMYFDKSDSPTLNKIKAAHKENDKDENVQELRRDFYQFEDRVKSALEVIAEEIDNLKECKKK